MADLHDYVSHPIHITPRVPRTRHLDPGRICKRECTWFLTAHGDGVDSSSWVRVGVGCAISRANDFIDEFFEREMGRIFDVLSRSILSGTKKNRG